MCNGGPCTSDPRYITNITTQSYSASSSVELRAAPPDPEVNIAAHHNDSSVYNYSIMSKSSCMLLENSFLCMYL